jgi:hypothetical protein
MTEEQLTKLVSGALRSCVTDHGPTVEGSWIGSATKRIVGQILATQPEGGESDAEAIALVKKYKLQVNPPLYPHGAKSWWVHDNEQHEGRPAPKYGASNESLNRAILECAMKMERDRSEPQKEQQ